MLPFEMNEMSNFNYGKVRYKVERVCPIPTSKRNVVSEGIEGQAVKSRNLFCMM